jgi:hypothetical protein
MNADWVAIMEGLPVAKGGRAVEAEFSGNDLSGEIPLADKVGDRVDRFALEQIVGEGEARLLFPESALHFREDASTTDLVGMGQSGGARIRILGRSVTEEKKGAIGQAGVVSHA